MSVVDSLRFGIGCGINFTLIPSGSTSVIDAVEFIAFVSSKEMPFCTKSSFNLVQSFSGTEIPSETRSAVENLHEVSRQDAKPQRNFKKNMEIVFLGNFA